tara:strand:- start:19868 stop:20638 length:771 start_codon:yes stop_codon:yes gene_type:complete
MADKVNPTNIRTEQLDEILQNNPFLVSKIIEQYYPATKLNRSGPFIPNSVNGRAVNIVDRLMTGGFSQDIDGFYNLIKLAIDDYLTRQNITDDNKVIFTENFTPQQFRSETISVKLVSREPGTTSQGKQMNRGRQNWRPELREIIDDPDHPNKKLRIYGQWFDNVIELCCWARTNKAANARALWLEQLMEDYMWFFKYEGVSAIRYEGRLADAYENIGDNAVHSRQLRYYVRTERITTVSEFVVQQILLNVALSAR